eukprot:936388_1
MATELQTKWTEFRQLVDQLPVVPEERTTEVEENTFHEFCRAIQKPSTLVVTREFLQALGASINPRLILSGFMIAKFPRQLLHEHRAHLEAGRAESDDGMMDGICFEHATQLMDAIVGEESNSDDTAKLRSVIGTFKTTFEEWKNHDMKKMVDLLKLNYTKYYASLRFITESASEHTQNILENELTRSLEISKQELTRLKGAEFVTNFVNEIEAAYNQEKEERHQNDPPPLRRPNSPNRPPRRPRRPARQRQNRQRPNRSVSTWIS